MPLEMNKDVFITCAVTGSGGTQDRSPHVPRSPEEIANNAFTALHDYVTSERFVTQMRPLIA